MKKKLIIIGTGPFGEIANEYFSEFSEYRVEAFSENKKYIKSNIFKNKNIIPLENFLDKNSGEYYFFIAIGYNKMNKIREEVFNNLKNNNNKFANFVHPSVKIWDTNEIGSNVMIFENNVIQPFCKIKSNTILWSGNHIGHHSVVGESTFISSHVVISGKCNIGKNVFVGVNATITNGITIANENYIGPGVTMTKSTKEQECYYLDKLNPSKIKSNRLFK